MAGYFRWSGRGACTGDVAGLASWQLVAGSVGRCLMDHSGGLPCPGEHVYLPAGIGNVSTGASLNPLQSLGLQRGWQFPAKALYGVEPLWVGGTVSSKVIEVVANHKEVPVFPQCGGSHGKKTLTVVWQHVDVCHYYQRKFSLGWMVREQVCLDEVQWNAPACCDISGGGEPYR